MTEQINVPHSSRSFASNFSLLMRWHKIVVQREVFLQSGIRHGEEFSIEESLERYTQSMTNIRRIPSNRCVCFSSISHSFSIGLHLFDASQADVRTNHYWVEAERVEIENDSNEMKKVGWEFSEEKRCARNPLTHFSLLRSVVVSDFQQWSVSLGFFSSSDALLLNSCHQ